MILKICRLLCKFESLPMNTKHRQCFLISLRPGKTLWQSACDSHEQLSSMHDKQPVLATLHNTLVDFVDEPPMILKRSLDENVPISDNPPSKRARHQEQWARLVSCGITNARLAFSLSFLCKIRLCLLCSVHVCVCVCVCAVLLNHLFDF